MMTIEEKRRELFCDVCEKLDVNPGDATSCGYSNPYGQAAWDVMNAALDAVVIELPSPFPSVFAGAEEYADGIEGCRAAIESTGLGLKIK